MLVPDNRMGKKEAKISIKAGFFIWLVGYFVVIVVCFILLIKN